MLDGQLLKLSSRRQQRRLGLEARVRGQLQLENSKTIGQVERMVGGIGAGGLESDMQRIKYGLVT